MITNNIKQGSLIMTTKEDGLSFKFQSLTSIDQSTTGVMKGLKQMQGGKAIYYSTGNQEVDTASFTLKPCTKDEFNFINGLWKSKDAFDVVFSHVDGVVNYGNPVIEKQPIFESISEEDGTFEIKLSILCESIDITLN